MAMTKAEAEGVASAILERRGISREVGLTRELPPRN